jgi:hypothetical protein
MRPLPASPPLRFGAASLPVGMELRLARRGGRAFAPRGQAGDVRVTLPEVGGVSTVLVPRGFGHPLPARRVGNELRAEPGGEPCTAARWVPTGGVAAWLRPVPAPRGPTHAVAAEFPQGQANAWVFIGAAALEWSALRLVTPAAGHGAAVVADRWVRAASPAARARGVVRGMSVALAQRRCPGLAVWPRPAGSLEAEVERSVAAWLGPVSRVAGGLLARLGEEAALGAAALAAGERLARLLWQELGVEVRVAVGASAEAARGLARVLEPGWVGVAAPLATDAWAGRAPRAATCRASGRTASWEGEPLPDLEGAAARARLLSPGLAVSARGGALRVRVAGWRGVRTVRVRIPEGCGRGALGRLVEAVVRREGAALGPITGVSVRVVPRAARLRAAPIRRAASAGLVDAASAEPAPAAPVSVEPPPRPARLAGAVRAAAVRAAGTAARPTPKRVERVVEASSQLALLPGLR